MRTRLLLAACVLCLACDLKPLSEHLDIGAPDRGPVDGPKSGDGPVKPKDGPTKPKDGPAKLPDGFGNKDGGSAYACPGAPMTVQVHQALLSGYYASMDVDNKTGDLHIAHQDTSSQRVLHSYRFGGKGYTDPIQTSGKLGYNTAVAVAPGGQEVHAVYCSLDKTAAYHAVRKNKVWQAHAPVPGLSNGALDMAFDKTGALHLVGFKYKEVRYQRFAGGKWQDVTTLESAANNFSEPALALDSTGKVHVTLCDGAGKLKYVTNVGGKFVTVKEWTIDPGTYCRTDIAVGTGGTVHIVYESPKIKKTRYLSSGTAGTFAAAVDLADSGDTGALGGVAVALTAAGDVWAAYSTAKGLGVRRKKGGSWGVPYSGGPGTGKFATAVASADGTLHVAHLAMLSAAQGLHYTRLCY